MLTVSLEELLRQVEALRTGLADLPSADDYPAVLGWLDLSLREAWQSEPWPDLIRNEERALRDLWDASASYSAGDQVYYPVTGEYYQAIRDVPAAGADEVGTELGDTLTGEDGSTLIADGTGSAEIAPTDESYWAELDTSYSGSDWSAATAYAVGDIVFQPDDDTHYCCHTAHTGQEPPNTSYWGALTRFDRYVAFEQTGETPIGEVFHTRSDNHLVTRNWRFVKTTVSHQGIQILEAREKVWIEFRLVPPDLAGSNYDSASAYAAGDQVYYTPTGRKGNLYDCLGAAGAGQNPSSNPELWQLVEIPKIFKGYLIWAAYAKALQADGETGKSNQAALAADGYLRLETDKLYRQMQMAESMAVTTY